MAISSWKAIVKSSPFNQPHSIAPWPDAVCRSVQLNYSKNCSFVGVGRGEGRAQCLPLSSFNVKMPPSCDETAATVASTLISLALVSLVFCLHLMSWTSTWRRWLALETQRENASYLRFARLISQVPAMCGQRLDKYWHRDSYVFHFIPIRLVKCFKMQKKKKYTPFILSCKQGKR